MAKFNAVIAGVGYTEYSKNSGKTVLSLTTECCKAALEDAGFNPKDVDGVAEFSVGDSVPTEAVAHALGVPLLYSLDWYAGGFAPCALVAQAAAAVDTGLAKAVLVYRTMNGRSGVRLGGTDTVAEFLLPKRVGQYRIPYGWQSYGQYMAMVCRRHMELYGTTSEHLGAIAINQRNNAMINDRAVVRKPLTMEEYLSSRMITDPFRLPDMSLETDGGCALLLTSPERAKDCRKKPVHIKAAGYYGGLGTGGSGDPLWIDSYLWPDHTEPFTKPLFTQLYKEAGIGPKDVDIAEIYDCFTHTVLLNLEGLGFCKKGEGGPFAASGAIGLKGEIPVNTNGGMLSEAYIHGMNVIVEAILQLRGECGARQVPDAEIGVVTSGAVGTGSGLVLSSVK